MESILEKFGVQRERIGLSGTFMIAEIRFTGAVVPTFSRKIVAAR
jgi:hypothetical protein